jgi:hypothetical protein
MSEANFWIKVDFHNEETEEKVLAGIAACYRVHSYTIETLNDYFIDHLENYRYHFFRRELGIFILKENLTQYAPRYSLVRAAEKSFPLFNEQKHFKNRKFVPVKPIPLEEYNEIQFENRKIWRKYLALNNLITTTFGSIFLSQNWIEVVERQVEVLGISMNSVPFLMHSVTLMRQQESWAIRFNLHDPDSKFGKLARKEMKEVSE